jgi:excisionase family DNA binding protein
MSGRKNERTPDIGADPQPQAPVEPELLTKAQLARRWNVSTRTIDNFMRERRVPFLKLSPKLVRFPRREADEYLTRHFRINPRN